MQKSLILDSSSYSYPCWLEKGLFKVEGVSDNRKSVGMHNIGIKQKQFNMRIHTIFLCQYFDPSSPRVFKCQCIKMF